MELLLINALVYRSRLQFDLDAPLATLLRLLGLREESGQVCIWRHVF
jgi:hypothetical protein